MLEKKIRSLYKYETGYDILLIKTPLAGGSYGNSALDPIAVQASVIAVLLYLFVPLVGFEQSILFFGNYYV